MAEINKNLIAPCGMNCAICKAYLREKNPCRGCNQVDINKPKTRTQCKIKNCPDRKGEFCFECDKFPCDSLKHLDKRYCERYDMSEIANLKYIRDNGINEFIENQCRKYQSDKGTFCIHDKKFY